MYCTICWARWSDFLRWRQESSSSSGKWFVIVASFSKDRYVRGSIIYLSLTHNVSILCLEPLCPAYFRCFPAPSHLIEMISSVIKLCCSLVTAHWFVCWAGKHQKLAGQRAPRTGLKNTVKWKVKRMEILQLWKFFFKYHPGNITFLSKHICSFKRAVYSVILLKNT